MHVQDLIQFKKKARHHSGQNRIAKMVSASSTLLEQAVVKGYSLRGIVRQLLQLLEGYGVTELEASIQEALLKQVPHSIFFFQAEDGIRDVAVTGVQTCALPISL